MQKLYLISSVILLLAINGIANAEISSDYATFEIPNDSYNASFIENNGQFGDQPYYRTEIGNMTLFFCQNEVTYVLSRNVKNSNLSENNPVFLGPGIESPISSKEYLALKT